MTEKEKEREIEKEKENVESAPIIDLEAADLDAYENDFFLS